MNDEEKTFRFLFVNQFVPPDPAPTARLAGDVAGELKRRGHEVVFVGDDSDYRGGKTLLGSRALREGFALLRILAKALNCAHGPCACTGSPTCSPAPA